MDEEELCAGPEGLLFAEGGAGACFLVSRLALEAEVGGAAVRRVEVEEARGVHDEVRPEVVVQPYRCDGKHADEPVLVVVVAPGADRVQPLHHHCNHHLNPHSAQRQ